MLGELDLAPCAWAIAAALPEVILGTVRGEIPEILALVEQHRPEVVLNCCEAPLGRPDLEAHVAALLEWLAIPFTGNGSETLALCRDKVRTKAVLAAAGIAVARSGRFPCIVKPAAEDGSVGIDRRSVCPDAASAAAAIARLGIPALVEEYLSGREFAVALWGREQADNAAIGTFRFHDGLSIVTYEAKWALESPDCAACELRYDEPVDAALAAEIVALARAVWQAVGARGYMRIDIRLDAEGRPRVIDVNPNPMLVGHFGMEGAAKQAGWTWERFLRELIAWARI